MTIFFSIIILLGTFSYVFAHFLQLGMICQLFQQVCPLLPISQEEQERGEVVSLLSQQNPFLFHFSTTFPLSLFCVESLEQTQIT